MGEVHALEARAGVTLTAHLVQVPEASRSVIVRGKGDLTEKKSVYTFVLADQSCAVQVTLWAELAETQAVWL